MNGKLRKTNDCNYVIYSVFWLYLYTPSQTWSTTFKSYFVMPNVHTAIRHFFATENPRSLELVFPELDIVLFHNGIPFHTVTKTDVRLRIQKLRQSNMAKMWVLDHLVFRFSFCFKIPGTALPYLCSMEQLPGPLANGLLRFDQDGLVLEFLIAAPSKELQVQVQHRYSGEVRLPNQQKRAAGLGG